MYWQVFAEDFVSSIKNIPNLLIYSKLIWNGIRPCSIEFSSQLFSMEGVDLFFHMLVSVDSSLLHSITKLMKYMNVLILSWSDLCFEVKLSLSVFMLDIISIFLCSLSFSVPGGLPKSLHLVQSRLLYLIVEW